MSGFLTFGKNHIFETINGEVEEYNVLKTKPRDALHPFCTEWVAVASGRKQKILISEWKFFCENDNGITEIELLKDLELLVQQAILKLRLLGNSDSLIYPYRFIELKKIQECKYSLFIGQNIGIDDVCAAECLKSLGQNLVINGSGNLKLFIENFELFMYLFVSQSVGALKWLHDNKCYHGYYTTSSVWITKENHFRISDSLFLPKIMQLCDRLCPLNSNSKGTNISQNETAGLKSQSLKFNDVSNLGKIIFLMLHIKKKAINNIHFLTTLNQFIEDCKTFSSFDTLLEHEFLSCIYPTFNEINKSLLCYDHIFISPQDFNNQRLSKDFYAFRSLGFGGYGQVIVARKKSNGLDFAIKLIPLRKNSYLKEVNLLSRLSHPNIVRYYGEWIENASKNTSTMSRNNETNNKKTCIFKKKYYYGSSRSSSTLNRNNDNNDEETNESESENDEEEENNHPKILYIQTEYCANNSLLTLFKLKYLCHDTKLIWKLFREMLNGLEYIHSQNIIHRDIKPANIFLTNDLHVKIGDFGLATILRTHNMNLVDKSSEIMQTANIGTSYYIAPEILREGSYTVELPYDSKCDVYSLGVVLFEMFYHNIHTKILEDILKKLKSKGGKHGNMLHPQSVDLPKIQYHDKNDLEKLFLWMLNEIPSERPTVHELINSSLVPLVVNELTTHQEQFSMLLNTGNEKFLNHVLNSLFLLDTVNNREMFLPQKFIKNSSYNLFFNHLTSQLKNIFGIYGLREQSCNSLMPYQNNLDSSTYPHALFIHRSGKILTRFSDLRYNFLNDIRSNIRRYMFGKFYINSTMEEADIVAVDFTVPLTCALNITSDVIALIFDILKNESLICNVKKTLSIGHTKILEAVCKFYSCDYNKFKHIQHFLHTNLTSDENKANRISSEFGLNHQTAVKFLYFLKPVESQELFENKLNTISTMAKDLIIKRLITDILKDFKNFMTAFKFPIDNPKISVIFDPVICVRTDIFSDGICYAARVDNSNFTRNQLTILSGGRYDKFFNLKRENNTCLCAYGININLSNICRIVKLFCQLHSDPGVIIYSKKYKDLVINTLKIFRENKYPASVYYTEKFSIHEILNYCKTQSMPYFLNIRDKDIVDFYEISNNTEDEQADIHEVSKIILPLDKAVHHILSQKF